MSAATSQARPGERAGIRSWFPIAAPPVVWVTQFVLGWFVSTQACPHGAARGPVLSLGTARVLVVAFTVAALAVTIPAILRVRRTVLHTREGPSAPSEDLRFFPLVALLTAATLTAGVVFNGASALFLGACGYTR